MYKSSVPLIHNVSVLLIYLKKVQDVVGYKR
jgi:hypothetical protein